MTPSARLSLRQLELFCAAAEHGSFAAAAQALFLTPNAVALAVRELESTVGAQLCVRHRSRGVTLTPSGAHLLDGARQLLRDADELYQSLGSLDGPLRGPVSVGCYSTLAATVLPPLMHGFSAAHPSLDLSIRDGAMADLVPPLLAAELDLLITYRTGLPDFLDYALLYETEVYVLLSERHPLAEAETIALQDLADDPVILLDLPPSGSNTLDLLSRAGVTPRIAHRTPNFEFVRALVGRNEGYSLLIQKPAIDASYEGLPVVAKRISPQQAGEAVVIAWPRSMRLTGRAQALVDFARSTVGSQQWTPSDLGQERRT